MKKKYLSNFNKKVKEEYLQTNEILWETEKSANLFVSNVMVACAIMLDICFVLCLVGVFDVPVSLFLEAAIKGTIELIVPALICVVLKGNKKWLKSFLMIFFIIGMARIQTLLGHSVILLYAFPVVLSVKYYSRTFTNTVAALSIIFTFVAYYSNMMMSAGMIDYNYASASVGTILTIGEDMSIRDALISNGAIDYLKTFQNFMMQGFGVRTLHFSIIAIICSSVAYHGRKMIFDQKKESEKTARISTELNLASDIQSDMLPNIFPAFPEREMVDVYGTMHPAKEVGGDFYDYFTIDEDNIALVIADVSGKGVPAAMFMVIAKTLIKDNAQLGLQPSEVFTRVNKLLCENNKAGLFVTAWMGYFNTKTGELTFVNAGHNPPVIKRKGKVEYLRVKPGFVLAGLDDFKYKDNKITLEKGDKLFLYTDGITEATSNDKELYGEDRLLKCIESIHNKNSVESIYAVSKDVNEFVGNAEQFDDMTMLTLIYSERSRGDMIERTYDAVDSNLHEVLGLFESELEKRECNLKTQMMISVMIEEIFVNICHYAYPEKNGKVKINLNFKENDLTVTIIDTGIEFNPLEKEDPDIHSSAEEREIGGLGIYMVKQYMDQISYIRKDGMNILTFTKKYK